MEQQELNEQEMEVSQSVDFIKMGNSLYEIKKVTDNGFDWEEKLRAYHRKLLIDKKNELESSYVKENLDDWNEQCNQVTRINRSEGTGTTVSRVDDKKMVYCNNGNYGILKPIIYLPNVINWYEGYMSREVRNVMLDQGVTEEGVYSFTPNMIHLKTVFLCKIRGRTYTPGFKTFHTLFDDSVCTGDYGENFMNCDDVELGKRLNRINTGSIGSSQIVDYRREVTTLVDYLNDATEFVKITSNDGRGVWSND